MATATLEKPAATSGRMEAMQEIYASLRPEVETEANIGKFLVVEPDTRDYLIDTNLIQAALTMRARHADPHCYIYRIGYPAAFSDGVRMERLP